MTLSPDPNPCDRVELAYACALQALPANELAAAQAHIAACPHCQRELESLRPVVDRFASWPADVLRPTTSLQARLALRIAGETGKPASTAAGAAMGRAGLGTGRARHRMQAAGDRRREAPGQHAGAPRAWRAPIPRIRMPASKSCIFLTANCGSTRASSPQVTTITVPPERATSASGARRAAPACSSPAPRTSSMTCALHSDCQL